MGLAPVLARADEKEALRLPVCGAVTAFCFPDELRRLVGNEQLRLELMDDDRLHVTVGLHPKPLARMSPNQIKSFVRKIRELSGFFGGTLVGIGEVGLDYTIARDTWGDQRDGLRTLLTELKDLVAGRVIVLHIRSIEGSVQAHQDALCLFRDLKRQGHLSEDQKVQLHYFAGHAHGRSNF